MISAIAKRFHPVVVSAIAFAALPALIGLIGGGYTLATEIVIYSLYAFGFNFLLAYCGLASFGASAFFGFSSYVVGLSFLYIVNDIAIALTIGVVSSALISIPLGYVILRRRGVYFALLTLAFTQLFYEVAFTWTAVTGGENGLLGISRASISDGMYYSLCSIVVVASIAAIWIFVHSPVGRTLQAIRDGEIRARCLGYNSFAYKLIAFAVFAGLVALAGGLLTFLLRSVYPNNLSWQHAGEPIIMTMIGGMHHFLGPIWGTALFIGLRDFLSAWTEHWWLFFGAALIGMLLLSPEGLTGLIMRIVGRSSWTLIDNRIPAEPSIRITVEQATDDEPGSEKPILSVQRLQKSFGSVIVARNIELDIKQRGVHAIIGPNGAGKTTFFNMLSGLSSVDGGLVRFRGRDVTKLAEFERARLGMAKSFQIVSIFRNLSVFECIRIAVQAKDPRRRVFWRNAYGFDDINQKAWTLLDLVGLRHRAAQLADNLSHGEKRLLEIAITLGSDPVLLLLDEPLAALSDSDRERIVAVIKGLSSRYAILIVEHDIDRLFSIADTVTVLHQGDVIAHGRPDQVSSSDAVRSAYLGHQKTTDGLIAQRAKKDATPLLVLEGVSAGYDGGKVIEDVSMTVGEGEVVALIGRNGVGKSTTLKTIMGSLTAMEGSVKFKNEGLSGLRIDQINRRGVSIVPEGRRIFTNLTVLENLAIAQRPNGWSLDQAFRLFPRLQERRNFLGDSLSGGERQMLAIARALMAPTEILLLDEPFEGLAPAIIEEVQEVIMELSLGVSILIVDHNIDSVFQMADRCYIMVNGKIVYSAYSSDLIRDRSVSDKMLSIG